MTTFRPREYRQTRIILLELLYPIVCEKTNEFELIYHPSLIGVFVGDNDKPELEDKIVLLFETSVPQKNKEFFYNNKYKYTNYSEIVNNKQYEILTFIIPPKFKKDVSHLLNNQIEKLSFAYKNHIEWVSALDPDNYPWQFASRSRPITKQFIQLNLVDDIIIGDYDFQNDILYISSTDQSNHKPAIAVYYQCNS